MSNYPGDSSKIINRWKEQILFFRTNCRKTLPVMHNTD